MSEFLQRLQERLKASKLASKEAGRNLAKPIQNRLMSRFSESLEKLRQYPAGNSSLGLQHVLIASSLSRLLLVVTALSAVYWVMQIAQIPSPPPHVGINKGLTLYSNQDHTAAYGLFGKKPLATENIYLRGVVLTSQKKDGTWDGFAIFEIDGKPTSAISVGEGLGKGLMLYSIGDETATLLYQGQKLDFTLSKASKEKNSNLTRNPTKK